MYGLTDADLRIQATARSFADELIPFEEQAEAANGELPEDVTAGHEKRAIELGLHAANMPAELGGGGLDAVGVVLVERELGRASYALQMLVERPSNILQACVGEQRDRYLIPAIRGERHDCVAMTEPGAGSDIRSMTTTASAVSLRPGWAAVLVPVSAASWPAEGIGTAPILA